MGTARTSGDKPESSSEDIGMEPRAPTEVHLPTFHSCNLQVLIQPGSLSQEGGLADAVIALDMERCHECDETADGRDRGSDSATGQQEGQQEVRALFPPSNPVGIHGAKETGFDSLARDACATDAGTGWSLQSHVEELGSAELKDTAADGFETSAGALSHGVEHAAGGPPGRQAGTSSVEGLLRESSVGMTSGPLLPERTAKAASVSGTAGPMSRRPATVDDRLRSSTALGYVKFLQHYFRRTQMRWPGSWRASGLAGKAVWRPQRSPNCKHGQALAPQSAFDAQAERWRKGRSWYKQRLLLLKKLRSGRTPLMLDLFCKAGGASAGATLAGASVMGVDMEPQTSFVARFGSESFVLGDATDMDRLRGLVRREDPFLIWASPPCAGYSSAPNVGEPSTATQLIGVVREALTLLGRPYVIENVVGARHSMRDPFLLCGQMFGLRQDRARLFETGGGFSLSEEGGLFSSGRELRARSCLGRRRRFPRSDFFGRNIPPGGRRVCCDGNIWATQGTAPSCGTIVEHASSMGVDVGHMSYEELAQAVPPDYAAFIVGQAAQHALTTSFGITTASLDALDAEPRSAQAQMSHWLRGAGGVSQSAGAIFVRDSGQRVGTSVEEEASAAASCTPEPAVWADRSPLGVAAALRARAAEARAAGMSQSSQVSAWLEALDRRDRDDERESDEVLLSQMVSRADWSRAELDAAGAPASERRTPDESGARWSLTESDFRELDYTHAGSYDRAVIFGDAPNWSARLRSCRRLHRDALQSSEQWHGRNTLVHLPGALVARDVARVSESLRHGRITVVASEPEEVGILVEAGFRRVMTWAAGHGVITGGSRSTTRLQGPAIALSFGRRECSLDSGLHLDHDAVKGYMDPRDRGAPSCGKGAKAALAWSWLQRCPERWRGAGFSAEVEEMMTEGVSIDAVGDDETTSREISQYPFKDAEHFIRGAQECDRALVCGHLEIVPSGEVEWALAHGSVHPWTVVHQSEDKWRSCQDYKAGTNDRVISSPFTLCSAHEVSEVIKPDSHFAKFDLRDGFWSVPVAQGSRHHLMVRHPATGRLLRCTSLPFGFAKSPQHFCKVTEAVAHRFRQRLAAAGIEGIHIFVFVDDYLVVGDTREQTQLGMRLFTELLEELGLPFAPHKTRGPTRVIEFLGFLLCNVDGMRCISLTAGRQARMIALIEEWQSKEPAEGEPRALADPRELASVLGQLVFASSVIPNSRVYMQAMLRQFAGLEIDWARGLVRSVHSAWSQVPLADGFWRDLHWWRSALMGPNCLPFARPTVGEVAIVGTDASDLACGELVWLDGGREEAVLLFTHAERRRPINFRELRGTLRALELWGSRLRGRLVLIETDNTFGHEATQKMRCKTEDGQELVRRIHSLAQQHGFFIRSVHTPGVMLIRPDQTSRGAAPEEPRVRLARSEFSALERRFGPFDEFLGAERELASPPVPLRGFRRLWAHPSFDTVGSTLRTICERMITDSARCPRGVVVVPFAPEAAWWRLTRHFACVGRWGEGSMAMEAAVAGEWLPSLSRRPTLLLAFPRAGSMLIPLADAVMLGTEASRCSLYSRADIDRLAGAWVNTDSALPAGTLLYSPRRLTAAEVASEQHGAAGTLYLTLESFDGNGRPVCAELRRLHGSNRHHFSYDRGSFARGGVPWAPEPTALWIVNHLGGRLVSQPGTSMRDRDTSRYIFDFDRAEADIVRLRPALSAAHAAGVGEVLIEEGTLAEDLAALSPGGTAAEADEDLVAMSRYAQAPGMPNPGGRRRGRAPAEGEPAGELAGAARVLSPSDGLADRRDEMRAAARSRRSVPLPAAGITAPSQCQYAAMLCRGCDQEIGLEVWMIPGGTGMVHNAASCYAGACRARDDETARHEAGELARQRRDESGVNGPVPTAPLGSEEDGPAGAINLTELARSVAPTAFSSELTRKPPRADKNQRVVQMDENLSEARRAMVRACIEGRCAHAGSDAPLMTCIGSCHRQLHGILCAQLSHGHSLLAVFECAECRLAKVIEGGPPYAEAALKCAEETMLQEMSSGAEKSGAGFADFVRLEAEWAMFMGGQGVRLPSDNSASLKLFLTWLVRDKERARSLGSLWRVIGSYMIKSGRVNLTHSDSSVKAHYSSLLDTHGVEEHPRTASTPRMIDHAVNKGVVEKFCPKPFISSRTKLDIGLETGCGVRVGEAMGSGDYHGVKAGHVVILRHIDTGLVTVELMLEHSKTKHKRWSNCLGTTLGAAQLPLAKLLREYWAECKWEALTWVEGGYEVTSVDYYVARVSMLGMTPKQLDAVEALLKSSEVAAVRRAATATMARARSRYTAKLSKDKRYVNVIGGTANSHDIGQVALEFERAGLGTFVSVVEGPLLRSTDGNTVSHMPLDPSTTYTTLHAIMDEAYARSNPDGDPDPWLDLQGLDDPLWGHHSFRRCADTVARSTMARTGVSEQDIDRVFGWLEAMYSQRMQYHYETRFNRDRRYRVTMYL